MGEGETEGREERERGECFFLFLSEWGRETENRFLCFRVERFLSRSLQKSGADLERRGEPFGGEEGGSFPSPRFSSLDFTLPLLPFPFVMPRLHALQAHNAASAPPTMIAHGRSISHARAMQLRCVPRSTKAKALVAPPGSDDARFLPTSSMPSSSSSAPRVRVFEKLASTVAINVSYVIATLKH